MTVEVEQPSQVVPDHKDAEAIDNGDIDKSNEEEQPVSPPDEREHRMASDGLSNGIDADSEEEDETANGKENEINSAPVAVEVKPETTENNNTTSKEVDANATDTNGSAATDEPDTEKTELANNDENPSSMALNVAYEALEHVRQANVAIEFGRELGPKECTLCLREPPPTSRFRLAVSHVNVDKFSRVAPCLTCGNPVCIKHRCPELKRENINICLRCSQFFALPQFVQKVHVAEDTAVRRELKNAMLDVYDRALLILQYSSQFIEEISVALEHMNQRNDKIGLGSSATGFVSGIAGVAAAVTIFTPAGPPLLIASILFGGGATAASAGSEAVNYRSGPNRMADTIIALHGMVHSISRLALEGPFLEQQLEEQDSIDNAQRKRNANPQARNWTRATANALKPLTAGALSAASVVMEAREMRNTLDKINAGSPCEKAENLRKIGQEMDLLPPTSVLAEVAVRLFKV